MSINFAKSIHQPVLTLPLSKFSRRFPNKLMMLFLPAFFVLFFTGESTVSASPLHPEKYYQEIWCSENGGTVEEVLSDGTRADCSTDTHVIEFDFGKKWAESLGQSLHYSQQTGKRAGIVLILGKNGRKYMEALKSTIERFSLPVDVWAVNEQP